MTFVYLIIAIILEVIGTSALQASEQFTKPKPLILTAIG
ncbi:SMR family transporter, partial [Acinetobacter baumannii]